MSINKTFYIFIVSLIALSANAARPVRGYYQVPIEGDLKAYATYPVQYKADTYKTNPNEISFPLPATLVGTETIVTMSKVAGQETAWAGSNVNGHCETIDRDFTCTVKFNDLQIDPKAVEAAVNSSFKTPEEVAGRIQVASHFSSEPLGIIVYKLRGGSGGHGGGE